MSVVPATSVIRRYDDLEPGRWPNDGGWTRQVWASERLGARWRLSLAEIGQPGPFSLFPQIDRSLIVASHSVLRLQIEAAVCSPAFADTVSFPGEAAVSAVADDGRYPVVVVNLMVGRGDPVAMAVVPRDGPVLLEPAVEAITVLSGRAVLADGRELTRWDSLLMGSDCPPMTFHDAVTVETLVRPAFRTPQSG